MMAIKSLNKHMGTSYMNSRLLFSEQDAREQERSYFPALRRCLAAYGSPPQPNSTRDDLLSAAG